MTEEEETFNVLIKGFKSRKEAEEFIDWYCLQGEQQIVYYLECRENDDVREYLDCDSKKTYPQKWEGNNAIMHIQE